MHSSPSLSSWSLAPRSRRILSHARFSSCVATLLLALVTTGLATAAPKKRNHQGASCSSKSNGSTEIAGLSARAGSSPPFVLQETFTRDLSSGQLSEQATVTRRGKAVIQISRNPSSTAGELHVVLGHGFKGVQRIDVAQEGSMFRAVVDGRRTIPFATGANPTSVAFEDGRPAPKLRVSVTVRKALKKFDAIDTTACFQASTAVAGPRPEDGPPVPCVYTDAFGVCDKFPGCNDCGRACFIVGEKAGIDAVVSCSVCLPCCLVGMPLSLYSEVQCENGCDSAGQPCCPVDCGRFCSAKGTVCCGNEGCAQDECCGNGTFCCSGGDKCVDPARGLCCAADHGDVCFGGSSCCPSAQSCIAGFQDQQTCCPTGDQACGPDNTCCPGTQECCGSQCCGPGQTCIQPATCCNVGDVCGTTCCPSHNCLNGTTCCDPPDFGCGPSCCGPLDSCCNGSCCAGQCISGSCCPPERVCGTHCCAPGYACTDPATGACEQCPASENPCPVGPGNPLCCPGGDVCCGNGTCCDTSANMTCCSVGGMPGCHLVSDCIK